MSGNNNTIRAAAPAGKSKTSKGKKTAGNVKKLTPDFEVDASPAARSLSKAFALTQAAHRSHSEKRAARTRGTSMQATDGRQVPVTLTPEGFKVVKVKDLAGLKRDTSETAKAFTRAMRLTHKNLHGKKAKDA